MEWPDDWQRRKPKSSMSELSELQRLIASAGADKAAGRLREAEVKLVDTLRAYPSSAAAQFALGVVLLSQGRYLEAWPLYEARRYMRSPPDFGCDEWTDQPIAGKNLVVLGEQGAGDQIMFARFLPVLRNMGANITLFCHPSLVTLLSQLPADVIGMSGEVEFSDPDYWVYLNSIPARLGSTLDTLPSTPYLNARVRRGEARIGLAMQGNSAHSNDANRSLPSDARRRLLVLPSAIDLNPGRTGAKDFNETAEIISGLDLVISVDTSVAHLAGAMGKPVWVLLPQIMNDWRWMENRQDTPWYPSARLFRQTSPGDWLAVVENIEKSLPTVLPLGGRA